MSQVRISGAGIPKAGFSEVRATQAGAGQFRAAQAWTHAGERAQDGFAIGREVGRAGWSDSKAHGLKGGRCRCAGVGRKAPLVLL